MTANYVSKTVTLKLTQRETLAEQVERLEREARERGERLVIAVWTTRDDS